MQPSTAREPVGLQIVVARRRIRQAATAVARRHGLPPQQFWALVIVLEAGAPSVGDLARRIRIDRPTASRVVAGLVRRRLVRLETDADDRRRTRIVATAAAARRGPTLLAAAAALREAVVRGFSAAEQEALRAGLARVIANMESLGVGPRGEEGL